MDTLCVVAALLGLVFGLLGFCGGCWACVQVLAFKRSTHQIVQVPVGESRVELDVPQHILDQMPSPPDAKNLDEYHKWLRDQQMQAAFEEIE